MSHPRFRCRSFKFINSEDFYSKSPTSCNHRVLAQFLRNSEVCVTVTEWRGVRSVERRRRLPRSFIFCVKQNHRGRRRKNRMPREPSVRRGEASYRRSRSAIRSRERQRRWCRSIDRRILATAGRRHGLPPPKEAGRDRRGRGPSVESAEPPRSEAPRLRFHRGHRFDPATPPRDLASRKKNRTSPTTFAVLEHKSVRRGHSRRTGPFIPSVTFRGFGLSCRQTPQATKQDNKETPRELRRHPQKEYVRRDVPTRRTDTASSPVAGRCDSRRRRAGRGLGHSL